MSTRSFRLQDLDVLHPLGKGGEGAVYCVRRKTSKERMALKVVSKYQMVKNDIPTLLAEQNTLSLLSENPWFLALHASWADSQNFYFATVRASCLSAFIYTDGGLFRSFTPPTCTKS